MEKATKIIGGVMTAVIFASVFAGSTLALYTSTRTVNNHIVSGGMKLKFYLTNHEYDVLDANGAVALNQTREIANLPVEYGQDNYVEGKGIDLSLYSGEVIQREKIVPLLGGKADFLVENIGDLAFDLTAQIINFKAYVWVPSVSDPTVGSWVEDTQASILADEQFTFTIKNEDATISETTKNTDVAIALGQVSKKETESSAKRFSVEYKFEDLDGTTFDEEEVGDKNRNNRAQNQKITFDIQILCTQAVHQ